MGCVYYRCLMIALTKFQAKTTDEIIDALAEMGWTGYKLVPEVVERSIQEITRIVGDFRSGKDG